jgi:hypothetical protein
VEPERLVQPLRREVRLANFEERFSYARGGKDSEEPPHQRRPNAATPGWQRHPEVENLSLIEQRTAHDIADDSTILGDEHVHAGFQAIVEVASRPGIGKGDAFDRDQGR